jgi:N-acyl-D-aspartate/D-glutamate deacylase
MDVRSDRTVYRLVGWLSRAANVLLGARFKWQSLPEIFDLWADGMDLVVFEEFGAGAAALHFEDPELRRKLIMEPAYRARFKREWRSRFLPKAFHRDFNQSTILACPDASLVGKSFAQAALERGQDPVDLFLDLAAEHGPALRWYTVMGNDRPEALKRIVSHPDVLLGFSDAGAHLRQMAHYNFPLRLLRLVESARKEGRPFMTIERAARKATGELAEWLGLDAGVVAVGRRADVAVIDPAGLDESVERASEAPMAGTGGFMRLVRRNEAAARFVVVNGRVAAERGVLAPEVGRDRGLGRLLRAR